jgi:hypothetical protein
MLGQAATTLILATIGRRATSTAPATRHRRHPYLSRLPDMTCARADAVVAATAVAAPRQLAARRRPDIAAHVGDAVLVEPRLRAVQVTFYDGLLVCTFQLNVWGAEVGRRCRRSW